MILFVSLKIEEIDIPQRWLLQISMPGQSSSSSQPSTESINRNMNLIVALFNYKICFNIY